jgi:hypothetical protein
MTNLAGVDDSRYLSTPDSIVDAFRAACGSARRSSTFRRS